MEEAASEAPGTWGPAASAQNSHSHIHIQIYIYFYSIYNTPRMVSLSGRACPGSMA